MVYNHSIIKIEEFYFNDKLYFTNILSKFMFNNL